MPKLLLYCTKSKPYLIQGFARPMHTLDTTNPFNYKWCLIEKQTSNTLNGKIVGECDYEVEEIYVANKTKTLNEQQLLEKSCLTKNELATYLPFCFMNERRNFIKGYAIHIKNLHIFDEPKELNEFYKIEDGGGMLFTKPLTNAPQNMMRVSVNDWEYGTFNPSDINVLISIRPKWLCKILNGEKTIEIRKKVLKGMLERNE